MDREPALFVKHIIRWNGMMSKSLSHVYFFNYDLTESRQILWSSEVEELLFLKDFIILQNPDELPAVFACTDE